MSTELSSIIKGHCLGTCGFNFLKGISEIGVDRERVSGNRIKKIEKMVKSTARKANKYFRS